MTRFRFDSKKNFKVLDLFSGIGGFSLGLERAGPFRTVAFCEQEPFCQEVLKKHWPDVPIYDDVKTIPTNRLGRIDLICGGFPCQPWSVAGQQRGAEDDRDLWPVMASLVEKLQPEWVIGENVRGFINQSLGLRRSLSDLESLGYQAIPFIIPACAVDAKHRRDRVWILAHSNRLTSPFRGNDKANEEEGRTRRDVAGGSRSNDRRQFRTSENEIAAHTNSDSEPDGSFNGYEGSRKLGIANNVANASSARLEGGKRKKHQGTRDGFAAIGQDVADTESRIGCNVWGHGSQTDAQGHRFRDWAWKVEPGVGRVAHGVPRRVDRLKALGNAVVPQVVEQIGRAIMTAAETGD